MAEEMSGAGSSWLPSGLSWLGSNMWGNKRQRIRDLRDQIKRLSRSSVLDDAGIDDAQILTLTRQDLNELFPGVENFKLRRRIMELITEALKDSAQPGPDTLSSAMKNLMQKSNKNDPAVQDVLKETLRAFREMEERLKAAQDSLKPYIQVLNTLTEASVKKEHSSIDWTGQTNFNFPSTQTMAEPLVRVHLFLCGKTFGADRQVFAQLKGVTESNVENCQLILVFCPVVSRAGTDIEEALKKIPANIPTVLVVMHHTFKPDFVGPSSNVSSSSVNILERVDIFYHDTACGLLKSPVNDMAINKIQTVLLNMYTFPS